MSDNGWERARTEGQKEQRVREIVAATARLYGQHNFEEITFASIAKEARFTRSNLYKYFSSKEEIFLEFLKRDVAEWREALKKSFENKEDIGVEEFSRIWVDVLVGNRRLLRLVSILNTFLEKNVSFEALIEFKRTVKRELAILSGLLCHVFPTLKTEQAVEFLNLQLAAASGLCQMTNLTETQEKVLEYEEFQELKLDFMSSLRAAVRYFISGLVK